MEKQIKQKVTELNLANMSQGLYLLKVKNGNHTAVYRVMKK